MKKIAFYVEGQTELIFLTELITEIAGQRKVKIVFKRFQGNRKPDLIITPSNNSNSKDTHEVLIYDCGGENNVKSKILEDASKLSEKGYSGIIGLQDLFPRKDYNKLIDYLDNGVRKNGREIVKPKPDNSHFIVANREIEEWFIKECNHYSCIDSSIILSNEQINKIGFNPCVDDLTSRMSSAAEDLKEIYQLAGKTYNKQEKKVIRTVKCLDYANLYIEVKNKLPDLKRLIQIINEFIE